MAGAQEAAAGADWAGLAELGIFAIGIPEEIGGAGGTTVDVAVVVEQLAAVLAPGPALPTLLAGLVLTRSTRTAGNDLTALLTALAAGAATAGVALTADGVAGTVTAEGIMRVSGTASLVLGAGDATHLLLGAATGSGRTWFVLDAAQPGVRLTLRSPVDFSRALADVGLDDVSVPAGMVLDGAGPRLVPDLAATLAAAEASGVATWCSQTATEYAQTRQQFGRPIGSFQAIKHLCAQMLCRAELATAAAWDSPGNTTRTCTCAAPCRCVACWAAARHGGQGRLAWPWPARAGSGSPAGFLATTRARVLIELPEPGRHSAMRKSRVPSRSARRRGW